MKYCCENCFLDDFLKVFIRGLNHKGKCDICKSHDVFVVNPKDIRTFLDPLILLYDAQVEFMPLHDLKKCEGRFIWEILVDDWNVFDNCEIGQAILEEIYNNFEDRPLFLDNYVDRVDEYHGAENEYSDSLKEVWEEFCDEIIYKNRFFPGKIIDKELMFELLIFLEKTIPAGASFWRARSCFDKQFFDFSEMGTPPPAKATSGRANPIGIPYLYLSSDSNTAIAEIRPQIADRMAVAEFVLNKNLNVIDLRNPSIGSPFRWRENLEFYIKSLAFLKMLGTELSKPVNNFQDVFSYLPTQYLCEFIKNKGFKGVLYNSNRDKGYNLVLFSLNNTKAVNIKYYHIHQIQITSKELVNDETTI